jgi:hypothetical protein
MSTRWKSPNDIDLKVVRSPEPAELDPELVQHLCKGNSGMTKLEHPLILRFPYFIEDNHVYNSDLRIKKEALGKAEARADWMSYIAIHERPFRLDAFAAVKDRVTDKTYWEILGFVWKDSENLYQFHHKLPKLLRDPRPGRMAMMDEQEHQLLKVLPNRFVVYRGHQFKNKLAFSWTLSQSKARWFALRFPGRCAVIRASIRKQDVIAVFLERNEFEIVVDPQALTEIKTVGAIRRNGYYKALLTQAQTRFRLLADRSLHGPSHWEQVEYFGKALFPLVSEVDRDVVLHFALLHDACRQNEDEDPKHGQRAANWLKRLNLSLDRDQKNKLIEAVRHHNDGQITNDPTVGVCWDSDRLDLPRVGISPDVRLLSTKQARDNLWML